MIKKVFPLIIMLSIFLTGCGEKKLDCSLSESINGVDINTHIVSNFKKKSLKSFKFEIENILVDYPKSASNYLSLIKKVYETYNKYEGVNVSFEEDDSKIKIIIDIDVDKMNDESKENFNLVDVSKDFSTIKSELISSGYVCK